MVKTTDVINWAKDLANRGIGVDVDGEAGTQCADLTVWILANFFGRRIYGDAIHLLNTAKTAGFQIIYYKTGVYPKAGDLFVMNSYVDGRNFGHTGLVIQDSDGATIKTIEQNYGPTANLTSGGPATYVTRNFTDIIGWIRPDYEDKNTINKLKGGSNMFLIQLKDDHDGANKKGGIFLFDVSKKLYAVLDGPTWLKYKVMVDNNLIQLVDSYKAAPVFTVVVTSLPFKKVHFSQM